ncbi:putative enzyme related to lactoylglutathione lyase [Sphingomonas zeicaulis]|uniref:VOC family protein n=1 Tax=Sphingomonas zeicaulis TaxID=1632740 RepID=UPI003D256FD2
MAHPRIEHINITVADPGRTAGMMQALFDWQVRWQGTNISGGRTVHVGGAGSYVALSEARTARDASPKGRPLNHIGIEVDDLDDAERRVIAAGLGPFNHGDYAPGRRFYFLDPDGIEYEVVSYR